jgi:hypothetical protein
MAGHTIAPLSAQASLITDRTVRNDSRSHARDSFHVVHVEVTIDPARQRHLNFDERKGRIQSAERAVPTHVTQPKVRTFFQPDQCGLQAAMKGDSYVSQSAELASPPTAS